MTYRVRVRRGEFEIEVESNDKDYVEAKLKDFEERVSKAQPVLPAGEGAESLTAVFESGKPISLVELKKLVGAETGTENTVAVAYYLEKLKGQQEYPVRDLVDGLKELRCNFKNYWDVVLKTKQAGFLMEGSSKKMLRLTDTGERWVESRLRGGASSAAT